MDSDIVERGLLVRYRVMAFTTATLLLVLVFVGIPLQLAAGRPAVVNVVGTIHGFLYIVYLYVAFALTRRLGVPKWQMALVLLAGTVPFCAFVAERKMTRRVEIRGVSAASSAGTERHGSLTTYAVRVRKRWFSRRALLLHLEVAIIAPGCVAAGWWQATRALSGNVLSWVYSIEWPAFALIAIAGWWYLIHEDPEAYRARKRGRPGADGETVEQTTTLVTAGMEDGITVERRTTRLATSLALLVGAEFALGIVALIVAPVGSPIGSLSVPREAFYLAHTVLGLPLAVGSLVFLTRVRAATRLSRLSGWIGAVGVAVAGAGGLLSLTHPLRSTGLACMLVGPMVAVFGYLIPTLEKLDHTGLVGER